MERTITLRELRDQGLARNNPDTATYGAEASDVLDSKPAAILRFDDLNKLFMAKVTITTGPDVGKEMYLSGIRGDMMLPFIARAPYGFDNVKAGDELRVDNCDWLAYMYYHRYGLQALAEKVGLATPENVLMYPEHRALMTDNVPVHPQRTIPTGWYPGLNGTFTGKMILTTGTVDEPNWPTQMTPYERMIRNSLGDRADEHFRFWWLDMVPHCSGPMEGPRSTRLASSRGLISQAVRDVMRWVEDGIAPPESAAYHYADDNALILPATAEERKGIQPVVKLEANGGVRAEVPVGTPVRFTASAEVPPGAGTFVRAEFDFDGEGTWPESVQGIDGSSSMLSATTTHAYIAPGTYLPAIRVGSHREGAEGRGELVYNLARARVVVR